MHFHFQEEVIRVAGGEALELGLLFGTENMTHQEEKTDVLCFAHLMLQEFVAGSFISEQDEIIFCKNNRSKIKEKQMNS